MQMLRRGAVIAAGAVLLAAPMGGAVAFASSSAPSTLTIGNIGDADTLDPIFSTSVPALDIEQMIFTPLYTVSPHGRLVPEDATHWTVSSNNLTYTFYLSKAYHWSDGQPVTAADYVFSMDVILNPKANAPGYGTYQPIIKSVTAPSPYVLQVTLKSPTAPFLAGDFVNFYPIPKHILDKVPVSKLATNSYGNDPTVTDGPYKFVAWKHNDYIEVTANPNYGGPPAHIQNIVYKIVPDQNTLVAELRTGQIQFDEGVPPQDVAEVKKFAGIDLKRFTNAEYVYMGFNFKYFKPFDSLAVRQAIAYGINRKAIVKDVVLGYGQLANGTVLPSVKWAYDPNIKGYNYHPNRAAKLLAAHGWKVDKNGILAKNGQELAFTLMTNAGNQVRDEIVQIIQQELAKLHIKVTPDIIDFSTLVTNYVNPGKFQALVLGWQLTAPDPDVSSIFDVTQEPPAGLNVGWYNDPIVNKEDQIEIHNLNQAVRAKAFYKIQEEMYKNPPYVFLYYAQTVTAFTSNLRGYVPSPFLDFYNIQNWSLK